MAQQLSDSLFTIMFRICASISALILATVFYRLLYHPLANVPGPRWAAFSNIWHAYHVRNGRMLQLGKSLHRLYGPVVRVGPNEVWFDTKDAYLKIYGATSGFEKSNFYVALALHRPCVTTALKISFPDTLDLLGEFDLERYRSQRRLIGPLYQRQNLLKFEKAIDNVLVNAIASVESLQDAEVDLKEWMHIIVVECLTAMVLSWSPSFLRDKTDHGSGAHAYLGWRRKSVFGLFPWAEVMDAYSRTLGRAFAKVWQLTYKPPAHFKALFPLLGTKTSRRITVALRPQSAKDDRKDLAADLIQLHKDKSEFTVDYLKRIIMTNFGAGHETTTAALTSIFAMLGTHAQVQRRVADELHESAGSRGIVPYAITSELKYTQAAIKEAQRLYPVIGMSLSRRVPAGGLHLHGHYFPPGTTVGCNPVALHRNPEIFGADAEKYRPERWLQEHCARDMERCNLIYGGGARTCPGRRLAEIIVSKVVATLVQHFEISVQMPPEEEVCYYFMAMLTGVKVRFMPRVSKGSG